MRCYKLCSSVWKEETVTIDTVNSCDWFLALILYYVLVLFLVTYTLSCLSGKEHLAKLNSMKSKLPCNLANQTGSSFWLFLWTIVTLSVKVPTSMWVFIFGHDTMLITWFLTCNMVDIQFINMEIIQYHDISASWFHHFTLWYHFFFIFFLQE